MFDSTVKHYKDLFDKIMEEIDVSNIEGAASSYGIHNLKNELLSNSKEFKQFAYNVANTRPGLVTQTGYACVVASIADKYEIPYKKYAGCCVAKNSPKYTEIIDTFNKGKAEGEEHPIFATHMYITINDKNYEYFNGETDNIEHLDVVEI